VVVTDEKLIGLQSDNNDLTGWERRTTTDEPRLSELVELYEELGFEVMLRPISREKLGQDCQECYLAEPDRFRTIYTRPATKSNDTLTGETPGEGL
jgi:hypothetical protein